MRELSQTAYEHLDLLLPGDTAAFWTEASKLVQRQTRKRFLDENQNLAEQIDEILVHTLENIDGFNQKQIAQTTLAMAKITSNVENGESVHDAKVVAKEHTKLSRQHKKVIYARIL